MSYNSVTQNNDQVVIDSILKNNFDANTMELLLSSIDLKNEIDQTVFEREFVCGENTEDNNRPKRKVTKTKKVEHKGFELVFLADARTFKPPGENDIKFVEFDPQVDQLVQAMQASQSRDEMYKILENYIIQNGIRDLPMAEQVHFAAQIAEYFPYSDPRSEFQTAFNQGAVDVFQMLTTDEDDLGGICGDIHAGHNDLIKRINPNIEAYTMSYATDNSQHVISYIADPDNPDAIYMTNYSRIEKKGTDGVAALVPTNTSMDDVGERVRFFQYKNGEQDHVGTFRNDIGSLLYELATDPFERSATPNDPRSSVQKIQGRWSKVVNKYKEIEKANGETVVKHKSYVINNDLVMFRGTTNSGNELIGILQKRQKLVNMDSNGELRPGERFGSQGYISTSISNVDYDRNFQSQGSNCTMKQIILRYILSQEKDTLKESLKKTVLCLMDL